MSVTIEFRHPVGMTTNVWQPSTGGPIVGTGQTKDVGVALDRMSDGITQYAYQIHDSVYQYPLLFAGMSLADKTALDAFVEAVKGDPFEYKDGACGPVTGFVTVHGLEDFVTLVWTARGINKWDVKFTLADAD
jgi:hypothetical protein